MRKKLIESAFYGFLLTLFGMSWYYVIGLALTLAQGGDIGKFAGDTLVGGLLCWGFFTFVLYELAGLREQLNRPRSEDKKDDPKDPKDGPRP
jgi:hypothetical protein